MREKTKTQKTKIQKKYPSWNNFLVLDQATNTGFAYFKNRLLLDYGQYNISFSTDWQHRCLAIYKQTRKWLTKYDIEGIIVEDTFCSNNVETTKKLNRLRGAIDVAAALKNVQVVDITNRRFKMVLTGKGNASDEDVIRKVKELTKVEVESDVADAIGMGLVYLQEQGH